MARRTESDEIWLVKYTNKLSRKRQATFDKARIGQIQLRLATEIVEFLTPKKVQEGEEAGRQSGSLQWRITRGEIESAQVTIKSQLNQPKEAIDLNLFYTIKGEHWVSI